MTGRVDRHTRDRLCKHAGVEEARSAASGVEILLGPELDLEAGTERRAEELLAGADFDYVLCSLHYLGDWPFDDPAHAGEFASGSRSEK